MKAFGSVIVIYLAFAMEADVALTYKNNDTEGKLDTSLRNDSLSLIGVKPDSDLSATLLNAQFKPFVSF